MSDFTALNLAILIGLVILFAAGYTWILYDVSSVRKAVDEQGEVNLALWNKLQAEIDTYRKPDGYVNYADYKKVMEKAGDRE